MVELRELGERVFRRESERVHRECSCLQHEPQPGPNVRWCRTVGNQVGNGLSSREDLSFGIGPAHQVTTHWRDANKQRGTREDSEQ